MKHKKLNQKQCYAMPEKWKDISCDKTDSCIHESWERFSTFWAHTQEDALHNKLRWDVQHGMHSGKNFSCGISWRNFSSHTPSWVQTTSRERNSCFSLFMLRHMKSDTWEILWHFFTSSTLFHLSSLTFILL